MSRSVDERVVEMRFDNANFERNVQTTMGTLDKLKQSLNLDGAAKGLESINEAAKNTKVSGLGDAVETVKAKFSALEVMAVTALANITNSVVNAGKQLVDSFTLEPIRQGFEEYELKMGAVQTIMASTGADIGTVNGYLDELNTYADKTIYSFSDMTQSIGKFTNAGVGLDDAVKAIQGISNEAAVSGANTNEASRAMYNFAQALSAGSVKLIDWKSIENANMATVEFKQALLDTAVAMGTVIKEGDEYITTTTNAQGKVSGAFNATKAFNDSLAHQWMTTDVLIQTLSNYSTDIREMSEEEKKAYEEKLRGIGYTEEQIKAIEELGQKAFDSAQDVKTFSQLMDTLKEAAGSGWSQTFEILFGDLEEAKKLWTSISQVVGGFIDQTSKARNDILQGWKDLGGRQDLIDTLKNAFDGLVSVIKPIGQALKEVFPPTTSKQLADLTSRLKEFSSHLKLSDADSQNLKNTFKGLFSVLDIVGKAIGAVASAIFPATKGIGSLSSGILSVTGSIGSWISSIDESIKKNGTFTSALSGVKKAFEAFGNGVGPALEKVKGFIQDTIDAIKNFAKLHFGSPDTSGLDSFSDNVKTKLEPIKKIGEVGKKIINGIVEAFKKAVPILANVGKAIGDAFEKIGSALSGALGSVDMGSAGAILGGGGLAAIGLGIKGFIDSLSDTVENVGGFIEGITEIKDAVVDTFGAIQDNLKAGTLQKIAIAIGILAASLLVLSSIKPEKLGPALAALTGLFVDLFGSMAAFEKLMGSNGLKSTSKVATTMIAMSAAVLILSSAMKKLASIDKDALESGLVAVTVLMAELVGTSVALSKWGGKVQTSAVAMIAMAAAVNILASAVKKLGELDPQTLTNGLTSVGVVMAELAAFMVGAKFGDFKASQGLSIIELAAALLILEKAVAGFGSMDTNALVKGLAGVGAVLAEVAVFSLAAGNAKNIMSSAAGLVAMGAAMLIFANAIGTMGNMSLEQLGKGLLGMAGALAAVTVAVNLMPKGMVAIGAGLIEVGIALKLIGSVMTEFGGMSWEGIAKGLVALAGSMTVLVVALNAMKGTLGAATAMLVLAAALAIFAPTLMLLGSMSLAEIGKGLLALAGAFTIMGVAGAVLGPLAPAIIALCGALALLGVAVAAVGVGVLAFSAGMTALSVSGVAGAAALSGIVTILLGLIPQIANTLAQGIITFATTIGNGAAELIAAATKVISEMCKAIITLAPQIVEAAVTLVTQFIAALTTIVPQVIELGLTIMTSLLQSIASHIGEIVQAAADICINFINGIAAKLPEIIQAGINLMISFINGMADGIRNNTPATIAAVDNLMTAVIQALAQWVTHFLEKGVEFINSLIQGLLSLMSNLVSSGLDLIGQLLEAIGVPTEFVETGKNLIQGLIDGVLGMVGSAAEAAKNVASNVLNSIKGVLGINSPSTEAMAIGQFFDEGFVNGLASGEGNITTTAQGLAASAKEGMNFNSGDYSLAGQNASNGFASGIDSTAANSNMQNLASSSMSALESGLGEPGPSKTTNQMGQNVVTGLIDGINAKQALLLSTVKNLCTAFTTAMKTALPTTTFNQTAQTQVMQGFINGLNAKNPLLQSTIKSICTNFISTMKTALPSATFNAIAQQQVMQGFINGLNAKKPLLLTTIKNICEALISQMKTSLPSATFNSIGQGVIQALINGLNDKKPTLLQTIRSICEAIIKEFENNLKEETFKELGKKIMDALADGMKSNDAVQNAAKEVSDALVDAFKNYLAPGDNTANYPLYPVGQQAANGLRDGIKSKIDEIAQAAIDAAKAAVEAAKEELDENSPSKVFFGIGKFVDQGLVNGILAYTDKVEKAGTALGKETISSMQSAMSRLSNAVESEMNTEPVIRPVLDLSDVQNGAKKTQSLFSGGLNVSATYGRVLAASTNSDGKSTLSGGSGIAGGSVQNTYQFTQNNYSPKALSRIDIYRQTRNQFAAMKGAVSSV